MNCQYNRLTDDDGRFIGFSRVIVEFLPAGADKWQIEPIGKDLQVVRLTKPPMGIARLPRARLLFDD